MNYARRNRSFYERPAAARQYMSVESMLAEPNVQKLEKVVAVVPEAGKLRPLSYNIYNEPTNQLNPDENIICSGNLLLIGAGDGDAAGSGYQVGVIPTDCKAGDRVACYTHGKFWLQLDWKGDAGNSRDAASLPKDLIPGSKAYYMPSNGLVTDKVPPVVDYIVIGNFVATGDTLKPELPWGIAHALVDLRPVYQTVVDLPAAAAISFSNEFAAFPTVSTADGLTIDLYANAQASDPNYQIKESDVVITFDTGGAPVAYTGFQANHTFASAGTYLISVVVGGTTFTYQVVVAAAAAPVFTAV